MEGLTFTVGRYPLHAGNRLLLNLRFPLTIKGCKDLATFYSTLHECKDLCIVHSSEDSSPVILVGVRTTNRAIKYISHQVPYRSQDYLTSVVA